MFAANDKPSNLGVNYTITGTEASVTSTDSKVMKRHFNVYSLIFMSFCITACWETIAATMTQSLLHGGSSSMVWGFVASACGACLMALSISEFASIIPTAGGQYHYVSELSPPKYRRFLSWVAGWLTLWSWILVCVSGIFAAAMSIQAYIVLFSPNYIMKRWHTCLIMIGLETWSVALGIFGIRWLHRLTFLGVALHIAGYLTTVIYLLANVYPKNSASWVFTNFTNTSGWKSDGVAWSIGLLTSALAFSSWDTPTHMAEEMKNASRDLPRALWGCVAVTGILTWPFVITLMFCITDVDAVLNGPVGSIAPLAQLVYNTSGGSMATTIGVTCFFLLIAALLAGPGGSTAASRLVWSFAKEGGLPQYFCQIDDKQLVPVNALVLVWFCVCALTTIYIGNSTAFFGIASGTTVVLIFTYMLPIAINIFWGIRGNNLKPGSFTLGRYGRVINIAAVCWALYIITFLVFPQTIPITATTMNYASIVFAFGFFLAFITWFAYGHKTYSGPLYEVDVVVSREDNRPSSKHSTSK